MPKDGKRDGPGRPPVADKMETFSLRLPPIARAWADQNRKQVREWIKAQSQQRQEEETA
jgi:hypothetical protein